jgi:hypothetical protein
MDCRWPGQDLLVYTFREIGVIWIGPEVFKRKHGDSFVVPAFRGISFQIAIAKASSDAITAKIAGFF